MTTAHRGLILRLPPNRVWRTYPGGRELDAIGEIAIAAPDTALLLECRPPGSATP